jgi:palmitoyl transferase
LAEFRELASIGRTDLHLSGVYWHLPFAYSPERRSRLNDAALGLGFGRSLIDAKDHERGLLVQVSRSSHYKPQYAAGYWWLARWWVAGNLKFGAGYTAFVFARSDIYHYLPLPGAVPLVSFGTDNAALYLTYLPRIHNAITGTGNVVYIYARVRI